MESISKDKGWAVNVSGDSEEVVTRGSLRTETYSTKRGWGLTVTPKVGSQVIMKKL